MHAAVRQKLPGFLKEYEGKFNFMYLDKKGLVTVGIGFLLKTADSAAKLDFQHKGGGTASTGEKRAEWKKVKASTHLINKGGSAFAAITDLVLSNKGIEQMMRMHMDAIEKYVKTNPAAKKYFGDFDNWPADAQMGLLGICWGIMPIPAFGWYKFPEACRTKDWATAAEQCRIKDAPTGRNQGHKRMFENAAIVEKYKLEIKTLHWPAILLKPVNIP